MSRVAILVDFRCEPGNGTRFLDLITVNAAASVRMCDVRENAA